MKKTTVISWFLLLFIILQVASVLISQRGKYISTDYWKRYPEMKKTYLDSQYVNKHPKGWIPDEAVNAYAGGAYVRDGVLPILIAPDTPPFGRYMIGLTALVAGNENLFVFISAIGSLIMLYILGLQVFKSKVFALLPVASFSFEPIFKNQLIYTPLLDIMQLFFLLTAFYLFNRGLSTKKYMVFFCTAAFFLGLFISTKFFITGLTVLVAWILTLVLRRNMTALRYYMLIPLLSVIVLLFNYIQLLFHGYTILKFLGVQKYIFLYHKTQIILPFTIWPLLLLNRWYVWFGDKPIISDSQWFILWPVLTVSLITGLILYLYKKLPQNLLFEPLLIWSVCYILFFSIGQITTRYLIIYIPVLYIIFFYQIQALLFHLVKKK